MRIGFDARKINREIRTGIEEYSYHLLENLLKIDSKNEYILYLDREVDDHVKHGLNLGHTTQIIVPVAQSPVVWASLALPLKVQFSSIRPDVLFMPVHYIPPFCPTKVLFVAYDLVFDHFRPLSRLVHSALVYIATKRATRIVAVSHATEHDLIKKIGVEPGRISVVHLGYDDRVYHTGYTSKETSHTVEKFGLTNGFILYCGTLQPRKNIVRLIEAYALILSKHTLPHKLVIVGKPGWKVNQVFRRVEQLGLRDRIVFTGYLPTKELALLLNRAAVFAFPSLYEGFGLPLLEAMACGVPVVTSDVSSMPEVVGDAAVLANPYDVQDLADAIARVLFEPNLRGQLTARGRERIKSFSWEKTARETLQVFEETNSSG